MSFFYLKETARIKTAKIIFASLVTVTILAATLLTGASLSSCSSNGKQWDPDDYTVKSGDTIYSIAWRYELDPEEFAAWNGIRTPEFIKPGQRLHTRKPANFDANRAASTDRSIAYVPSPPSRQAAGNYSNKKLVKAEKGDTLYGLSKRYGVSVDRLVQLNQLKKPYVIQPGQTIFLKPLNSGRYASGRSASGSPASGRPASGRPAVKTTSSGQAGSAKQYQTQVKTSWPKTVRWQRPANGKVVKKFNRWKNDAKGIDIAGKEGNAIVAASGGKVVYSGGGLISYGNLIIIKHNKTFLSAYAYNRKLLVKEGDMVKAGQQIAEMGHKDKSSPQLHFEIRKNGKPVDPLKYLPW